jgi:hypothetical protein
MPSLQVSQPSPSLFRARVIRAGLGSCLIVGLLVGLVAPAARAQTECTTDNENLRGPRRFSEYCASHLVIAESRCETHELDADQLKQRLRRWRGMSSFNRWRLTKVEPAGCVVEGNVVTTLTLVPPVSWSHHRVPYRVQIELNLEAASGNPVGGALTNGTKKNKRLASGVRRLVLRAEAHEDVRRFIERFSPSIAAIEFANGAEKLQVTYFAAPKDEYPANWRPNLVYSEAVVNGVTAYNLPRMDSLPVRREMLRFIESVSSSHPHCRPIQIKAHFISLPTEDEPQAGRWQISSALAGSGCPDKFAKVVTHDLTVVDWTPAEPKPAKTEK